VNPPSAEDDSQRRGKAAFAVRHHPRRAAAGC